VTVHGLDCTRGGPPVATRRLRPSSAHDGGHKAGRKPSPESGPRGCLPPTECPAAGNCVPAETVLVFNNARDAGPARPIATTTATPVGMVFKKDQTCR
jgi:hypothetical protein